MVSANRLLSELVLRIQLADIRQNEDVLSLLSLSSFLPIGEEDEERVVRYWSKGQWGVYDLSVPPPSLQKINTVVVQCDFRKPRSLGVGIDLIHARSVLTISPTSSLWASVIDCPSSDPEAEALRSYFESVAQALAYRSITIYPSLIDVQFLLRTELSITDCLKVSPAIIRDAFPSKLRGVPLMGVVDCSDVPSPGDLLTERFMDQSDYVSIGRRFPSLHPVLIGEYGTLSNIKDVIGEEAELLEISQGPKFRLGTLYVRSEVVDSPETRRRLVSWLAAAPELAPFAGEYEIRGAKILSLRRSRELESAGVLSKLPEGFVRYLLVSAAHCAMIGVDPEDMITYIGPASQVMKAQAAADREFFRTDRSLPVRDRVWLAYDATSFKNVAAELKVLLKRVYFGR